MWIAPGDKVVYALTGAIALAGAQRVAPQQMASYIGTIQWYALTRRELLSVLDDSYRHMRGAPYRRAAPIKDTTRFEIIVSATLAIFWQSDMRDPLLNLLGATDASTSYGYGAAVATLDTGDTQALIRQAQSKRSRATLNDVDMDVDLSPALGAPCTLPLEKGDFRQLFSVRARKAAHVNLMEGTAVLLYLEWLLRSTQRHGRRVVILNDSKVMIGALEKGRSSARRINAICRRAAALMLAGNLNTLFVYIHTSENPGDGPSRGCARDLADPEPPERRPKHLSRPDQQLKRYLNQLAKASSYITTSSDSGDSSSCSSGAPDALF